MVNGSEGIFNDVRIPKRKFLQLKNAKISYIDVGKGPIVVSIPCWPASSLVYLPFFHAAGQNFRLISLDLPGWAGYSESDEDHRLLFYVELVEEFIQSLGLTHIHLLGFSFGGLIAQHVASRKKVEFEKLILVSSPKDLKTIYTTNPFPFMLFSVFEYLRVPMSVVRSLFSVEFWTKYIVNAEYQRFVHTKLFREFIHESELANMRSIFHSIIQDSKEPIKYENLQDREVLAVFGEKEPIFVEKGKEELKKRLHIKPVIIPNTDHNHLVYNAPLFARIFHSFLNM